MFSAMDYAKIFINRGLDTNHNTYDGNMKLQKLLFFADYISLVKRNTPLFSDPIRAFSNGCVIEKVRLRYKNDYTGLLSDSRNCDVPLNQEEYDILTLTQELFGGLTARELSELNHTFDFWERALNRSINENGFYDKDLSIVSPEDMLKEKKKLEHVLDRYRANKAERAFSDLINGVKFYYAPDFEMNDETLFELEKFSMTANDSSYSVYFDKGNLVIY